MIKKLDDGRFKLDFRPAGSYGLRVVRIRSTRKELKLLQAEFEAAVNISPLDFTADKRSLRDLVQLWFKLHGVTLRDSKYRLSRTLAVCDAIGNPPVNKFTTALFSRYREKRLFEVSVSTVNHETRYLRAVFAELIRLGQYHGKNPLAKIRTFAERDRELSFLTAEQIGQLLKACDESGNNHCGAVARLCLATGARWGSLIL